jgi:hypothetical protein
VAIKGDTSTSVIDKLHAINGGNGGNSSSGDRRGQGGIGTGIDGGNTNRPSDRTENGNEMLIGVEEEEEEVQVGRCSGCLDDLTRGVRMDSGSVPRQEGSRLALMCPDCKLLFCVDCDLFVHDSLHNCPGCC